MSKNKIIENLNKVLADNYALYLKTQNYHWNVTSTNFLTLHELFEKQYDDLFSANDEIAERIRILGSKVTATFTIFRENTAIKDGNENLDAASMVRELAEDQKVIIKTLKAAKEEAEKNGDDVTAGMLSERIGKHEENAWMLNSSL